MSDDTKPEPWYVVYGCDGKLNDLRKECGDTVVCAWWDVNGGGLCFDEEDARRIAACVNYCANMPTEYLEANSAAGPMPEWAQRNRETKR